MNSGVNFSRGSFYDAHRGAAIFDRTGHPAARTVVAELYLSITLSSQNLSCERGDGPKYLALIVLLNTEVTRHLVPVIDPLSIL